MTAKGRTSSIEVNIPHASDQMNFEQFLVLFLA
jgi:hypothetical protein